MSAPAAALACPVSGATDAHTRTHLQHAARSKRHAASGIHQAAYTKQQPARSSAARSTHARAHLQHVAAQQLLRHAPLGAAVGLLQPLEHIWQRLLQPAARAGWGYGKAGGCGACEAASRGLGATTSTNGTPPRQTPPQGPSRGHAPAVARRVAHARGGVVQDVRGQEEARDLEGDGRLNERQRVAQDFHHLGG